MNVPTQQEVRVKCVLCGKNLLPYFEDGNSPCDVGAWDGGFCHTVVGGFGSTKFDMSELLVGFCDECADKAIKDGRLIVCEAN